MSMSVAQMTESSSTTLRSCTCLRAAPFLPRMVRVSPGRAARQARTATLTDPNEAWPRSTHPPLRGHACARPHMVRGLPPTAGAPPGTYNDDCDLTPDYLDRAPGADNALVCVRRPSCSGHEECAG